jgi:hypothetical protein
MTLVRWIAVAIILDAAVLLVAGIGDAAVWFACIAVGMAMIIIDQERGHHGVRS